MESYKRKTNSASLGCNPQDLWDRGSLEAPDMAPVLDKGPNVRRCLSIRIRPTHNLKSEDGYWLTDRIVLVKRNHGAAVSDIDFAIVPAEIPAEAHRDVSGSSRSNEDIWQPPRGHAG